MSSLTTVFPVVSLQSGPFLRAILASALFIGPQFGMLSQACAAHSLAPSQAAPPAEAAPPAQAAQPASVAPDITEAVDAFTRVRGWLDTGKLPEPEQAANTPTIQAAGIVLRLGGRVVGTGKSIAPESGVLARALRQAVNTARQDAALVAIGEGALARLTLELELGGPPEPLVGSTFEEALEPLQPAAQGLALRNGETWGYLPSSVVLARGMASPLSRSVLVLLTDMKLPPRDLPELRAGGSTAIYRVPSVRLQQARPDGTPSALHRLTNAIATEPLDDLQIAAVAQRIAARLAAQVEESVTVPDGASPATPGQEAVTKFNKLKLGLIGPYNPSADDVREAAASPVDQALCAYALARAAECPTWSSDTRTRARVTAASVLADLAIVEKGEQAPVPPTPGPLAAVAAPYALLALETLRNAPGTNSSKPAAIVPPDFERSLTERVTALLPARDASGVTPNATARAIAFAAAAARERAGRPLIPGSELAAHLNDAWTKLTPNSVLSVGPWLLVAERELRRSPNFEAKFAAASATRMSAQTALLDGSLAALIGTQASVLADPATPPDSWGAYPVTEQGHRRMTAQSAVAMHLVALLRNTPRAGAADQVASASRSLRRAARFLAQLQVGSSFDYAMRSPARAHGGIMAAPYDPEIAPAAQGMALLALVEAQDAPAKPSP